MLLRDQFVFRFEVLCEWLRLYRSSSLYYLIFCIYSPIFFYILIKLLFCLRIWPWMLYLINYQRNLLIFLPTIILCLIFYNTIVHFRVKFFILWRYLLNKDPTILRLFVRRFSFIIWNCLWIFSKFWLEITFHWDLLGVDWEQLSWGTPAKCFFDI